MSRLKSFFDTVKSTIALRDPGAGITIMVAASFTSTAQRWDDKVYSTRPLMAHLSPMPQFSWKPAK